MTPTNGTGVDAAAFFAEDKSKPVQASADVDDDDAGAQVVDDPMPERLNLGKGVVDSEDLPLNMMSDSVWSVPEPHDIFLEAVREAEWDGADPEAPPPICVKAIPAGTRECDVIVFALSSSLHSVATAIFLHGTESSRNDSEFETAS